MLLPAFFESIKLHIHEKSASHAIAASASASIIEFPRDLTLRGAFSYLCFAQSPILLLKVAIGHFRVLFCG